MISLASRISSILLLILVLNLVVCQAGRVKRYDDDDEYDTLRKQRLWEKIVKDIEEDKRQQRENERDNKMFEMFGLLIQTIIGIAVLALMIFIIYRCIKKSRQYDQEIVTTQTMPPTTPANQPAPYGYQYVQNLANSAFPTAVPNRPYPFITQPQPQPAGWKQ